MKHLVEMKILHMKVHISETLHYATLIFTLLWLRLSGEASGEVIFMFNISIFQRTFAKEQHLKPVNVIYMSV